MHNTLGKNITLSLAGESHGEAIGMILSGIPAGFSIDMEALSAFLKRRAPGQNRFSTPRKEGDTPEFLSGIYENVTTGSPIMAIIRNTNTKSGDYAAHLDIPRPGHADITAKIKYGGYADMRGGGHFSGRLTAPLTLAGGIALQMLKEKGIEVFAHIRAIHGVEGTAPLYTKSDLPALRRIAEKPFPVWDDEKEGAMMEEIDKARGNADSVGGVIEVCATGLPAGLGSPMFSRLEGEMAHAAFAVPAIRGIEFGNGFDCTHLYGSENNDAFIMDGDTPRTETNRCGGTLGGISTGMPFVYRVAVKPTSSIGKEQKSISFSKMEETEVSISGRHDPCILPRCVPVMEAVTALVILDALFEHPMVWRKEEK